VDAKLMKISIIIVHYNTTELLATCLDSIIKKTNNVDYEIIVIDNNSPDRSCLSLQKKYPQVTFIFLDKNLG
jgi:N-acetylglucosaminyl-diphospho-decaprenol L-rhamnosyltransferase